MHSPVVVVTCLSSRPSEHLQLRLCCILNSVLKRILRGSSDNTSDILLIYQQLIMGCEKNKLMA